MAKKKLDTCICCAEHDSVVARETKEGAICKNCDFLLKRPFTNEGIKFIAAYPVKLLKYIEKLADGTTHTVMV